MVAAMTDPQDRIALGLSLFTVIVAGLAAAFIRVVMWQLAWELYLYARRKAPSAFARLRIGVTPFTMYAKLTRVAMLPALR